MINGLQDRQAVKVGEKYLVCLKYTYGFEIVVDGKLITIPQTPFLVDRIDNFQYRSASKPKIIHYIDPETQAIISHGDLSEVRNQYYNKNLGEYMYPTLEVEFEHRKKLEKLKAYTPVYEDIDPYEYTKIEFTVVGEMIDTGSDFIQSALSVGLKSFSGENYMFRLDGMSVAMDEILKFKDKYPVDIPTHSGLRYAKVGGTYLFRDGEFWWMNSSTRMTTTLQQAKDLEASIRKAVRDRVNITQNVDIPSKIAYNTLYSNLRNIQLQVMSISAMKNSSSNRSNALLAINKLITTIESNIQELEREEDTAIK